MTTPSDSPLSGEPVDNFSGLIQEAVEAGQRKEYEVSSSLTSPSLLSTPIPSRNSTSRLRRHSSTRDSGSPRAGGESPFVAPPFQHDERCIMLASPVAGLTKDIDR